MKPENIPEYDKDVTNNIIRNRPNDGQPTDFESQHRTRNHW